MLLIQLLFLSLFSFTPNEPLAENADFKDYYFPYEQMEEGLIYVYQSDSETADSIYVHRKSEKVDGNWYLITQGLTKEGRITDYTKERITETGSVIEEYIIFGINMKGNSDTAVCKIEQELVFPFKTKTGENSIYEISYAHEKYSNINVKETRTRSLNRKNVPVEFLGVEFKTIEFQDNMKISFWEDSKQVEEGGYKYRSYYAKGLGLVKYTLEFPDKNINNTLIKIMKKSEWEQTNN